MIITGISKWYDIEDNDNQYRRSYNSCLWEELMGQSWESCDSYEHILEEKFQILNKTGKEK